MNDAMFYGYRCLYKKIVALWRMKNNKGTEGKWMRQDRRRDLCPVAWTFPPRYGFGWG
jgi:hypothetical protein